MSGGGGDPVRLLDRLAGACFVILLGAMALYGAVQIIASVWLPLSIGVTALAGVAGGWFLLRRSRGF